MNIEASKEGKREKFVRLAERRVEVAINKIALLGNLANRNTYEYGDNDVEKMLTALTDEVANVEAQFSAAHNRQSKKSFSL